MRLLSPARVAPAAALLLAASLAARAQEASVPDAARALGLAAKSLPAKDAALVRQRALMLVLLAEQGRLVPAGATPSGLATLEDAFLAEKEDSGARASLVAGLPGADDLVFNGKKLSGGNFKAIDALVGVDGRPIALDRKLPAFLVPLSMEDAESLMATGEAFRHAAADLAPRIDAINRARVSSLFVADGLAVRPYAGRIDDLYFHLAQEGPRGGAVDFYALTERIPYDAVSGPANGAALPAPEFSMSDLLSGGALVAVGDFLKANPGLLARNPFTGFAVRVLPYMGEAVRAAAPGTELKASREVMKRALADPRRFTPAPVPPLFQDRSRFLGMVLGKCVRVANKQKSKAEFSNEIANVESETLLPDEVGEPAANEFLVDTRPEAVAPDPPDLGGGPASALAQTPGATPNEVALIPPAQPVETLAETKPPTPAPLPRIAEAAPANPEPASSPSVPAEREEPRIAKAEPVPPRELPVKPAEPVSEEPTVAATEPVVAAVQPLPEPPREEQAPPAPTQPPAPVIPPPQNPFQVAVLVPTVEQAEAYAKAIRESDARLSANSAALNRALCYQKWLADALAPIETALAEAAPDASLESLEKSATLAKAAIARAEEESRRLRAQRMEELTARGALRHALEQRVRTERGDEMRRLAGSPV
jgi:hypothetical protein